MSKNYKLIQTILTVLFLSFSSHLAQAQWSTSGNSGSGLKLGITDLTNSLNLYTQDEIRATITTAGDFGVGTQDPRATEEILYCPVNSITDIGLIVTNYECPGSNGSAFAPTMPDIIGNPLSLDTGLVESVDTFIIPFSFLTSNFTNITVPLYTSSKPLVWVRNEAPTGSTSNPSGADRFDTKFIVMPDGSTGINISQPRCALDVRGSQAPNRPVAIFGSRAMGTGASNPSSGLYQYYTQQLHIVPNLKANGYNQISQLNDQGLFFSNGQGDDGANSGGALVIAPWAENADTNVGGMRMDQYGNTEFHGTLRATKIKINTKWWSDFVFEPDYQLRSIGEVSMYIKENGHLPDMPSESEVIAGGQDLSDIQALQQQKIEELTLYIIQLQEQIDALKSNSKK